MLRLLRIGSVSSQFALLWLQLFVPEGEKSSDATIFSCRFFFTLCFQFVILFHSFWCFLLFFVCLFVIQFVFILNFNQYGISFRFCTIPSTWQYNLFTFYNNNRKRATRTVNFNIFELIGCAVVEICFICFIFSCQFE